MINKDEYIKVDYIDFLTICDEHGKCYDVEDFKDASSVNGLIYLEIILEDNETVKVIMGKDDYELLEEDLLK